MKNGYENIEKFFDIKTKVICKNSTPVIGVIDDWISEYDNDPDPEAIIVNTSDGLIMVYVKDIISIEELL